MSTSRCLAATPTSHNWWSTCGKPCYRSHTITPGGVPNTNNIRNVPWLPNSSTYYWGGQPKWTHPYTPQRAHSHWQHLPTRATTQEFLVFIRHPEPQLKRCHSEPQLKECHVLNPYPEQQIKGYVPSHNSRNTNKPTFEESPKRCRSRTTKTREKFKTLF